MFNSTELVNEYNLLNDFLNSSLLDESIYQPESNQATIPATHPHSFNGMPPNNNNNNNFNQSPFANNPAPTQNGVSMSSGPVSSSKKTKSETTKESYFMEAADPAGVASPEERMRHLLKVKYEAGLLKPFNYVEGYQRMSEWMNENLHMGARNRITQQFNRFRPMFKERIKPLTDLQLVEVEMWFERELMKYDRVFASMAIPACCWRRTGDIYRGNREMAELLGLREVESLRDVSFSALHLSKVFDYS